MRMHSAAILKPSLPGRLQQPGRSAAVQCLGATLGVCSWFAVKGGASGVLCWRQFSLQQCWATVCSGSSSKVL